ncbi:MAG TPA: nuclear transport factor 2 family protein [Pseudonocardiaceae bacterium]
MTSTIARPAELTDRVHEFYRLVDAGALDDLAAMFAQDAHYDRPGYPTLSGRAAIDHFYRHERVIAAGQHRLDSVVVSGNETAVRGSFDGVLRDGKPVRHRFAEFFVFTADGLIGTRETFFAIAHV